MSPIAQSIKSYKDRLVADGYDVVDRMPKQYTSPVIVIGSHDDDAASHKNGAATFKTTFQIDYFCDTDTGRYAIEDEVCRIKNTLRERNITSRLMIDKVLQKELYHVVFEVITYV